MRHNRQKIIIWWKKQKNKHGVVGANSKHTQEQWEGEWFITTVSLTVKGLRDMRNFFRSHLQTTKIFWTICMQVKKQKKTYQNKKGQQRQDVARCVCVGCSAHWDTSLCAAHARWAICCVRNEAAAQHPCVGTKAIVLKAEAQITFCVHVRTLILLD